LLINNLFLVPGNRARDDWKVKRLSCVFVIVCGCE
jgi:hypothetical protein